MQDTLQNSTCLPSFVLVFKMLMKWKRICDLGSFSCNCIKCGLAPSAKRKISHYFYSVLSGEILRNDEDLNICRAGVRMKTEVPDPSSLPTPGLSCTQVAPQTVTWTFQCTWPCSSQQGPRWPAFGPRQVHTGHAEEVDGRKETCVGPEGAGPAWAGAPRCAAGWGWGQGCHVEAVQGPHRGQVGWRMQARSGSLLRNPEKATF